MDRLMNILLIEDNLADVRIMEEALIENNLSVNLFVVSDGIEALAYLNKSDPYTDAITPDLILLDLNMPRMGGRETLDSIKKDPRFRRIPTVVLTTSNSEEDIKESYKSNANAFITKPADFDQFVEMVKQIQGFWFTSVKLPQN